MGKYRKGMPAYLNDIDAEIIVGQADFYEDEIEIDIEIEKMVFIAHLGLNEKNLYLVHEFQDPFCAYCNKKREWSCDAFDYNIKNKQKVYDAILKKYRIKFLVEHGYTFKEII